MARKPPPKLALVRSAPRPDQPEPPADLEETGRQLWRTVMTEYDVGDSGGRMLLGEACRALDRAEQCARQLAEDGLVVRTKSGIRDHPLLRHETANRALAVRTLMKLGLDLEPVRPHVGRPPGR